MNYFKAQVIVLKFLDFFFKPAGKAWFDRLEKEGESELKYSIKAGNIVLKQFGIPDLVGKTVLDFGCGNGGKSLAYAMHGARVIGCDKYNGCSIALDFATSSNIAFDFKLMLSSEIPLPDKSIDMIVSSSVLEHVDNVDIVMKEFERILRPDGKIYIRWHPFKSRYGSHLQEIIGVPFAHFFFSERALMFYYTQKFSSMYPKLYAKFGVKSYESFNDLSFSLNRLSIDSVDKIVGRHFIITNRSYFLKKQLIVFINYLPLSIRDFFIDYEVIRGAKK